MDVMRDSNILASMGVFQTVGLDSFLVPEIPFLVVKTSIYEK